MTATKRRPLSIISPDIFTVLICTDNPSGLVVLLGVFNPQSTTQGYRWWEEGLLISSYNHWNTTVAVLSTSYHFRANIVIDHCGFCFLLFTDDETTYPFPVDTKRINELVHSRKLARTFRQGRYECDVDDNSALDCCGREPHTRSIALDGELKTNFWNEKINKPHTDGWYTRDLLMGWPSI